MWPQIYLNCSKIGAGRGNIERRESRCIIRKAKSEEESRTSYFRCEARSTSYAVSSIQRASSSRIALKMERVRLRIWHNSPLNDSVNAVSVGKHAYRIPDFGLLMSRWPSICRLAVNSRVGSRDSYSPADKQKVCLRKHFTDRSLGRSLVQLDFLDWLPS